MITALIIYEDRLSTWRRMKVLDLNLDTSATSSDVKELAELRIRNLLCFNELQNFNDKGVFLGKHPFITNRQEMTELKQLWSDNKSEFIRHYENCRMNIRRYRSRVNSTETDDANREKASTLLSKHLERERIFKEIIGDETKDNNI